MSEISYVLSITSMLEPTVNSASWLTCLFEQLLRWLKVWKEKDIEFEEETGKSCMTGNITAFYVIIGILLSLQAAIKSWKQTQLQSRKLSVHLCKRGKSLLSGLVEPSPPAIRTGASCCSSISDDITSYSPSAASTLTYASDETAEITIESIGGRKIRLRLADEDGNSEDPSTKILPQSLLTREERDEKYDLRDSINIFTSSHNSVITPESRRGGDHLSKNVSFPETITPSVLFDDAEPRSLQNHMSNDLREVNLSTPSLCDESPFGSGQNLNTQSKNVLYLSASSLFPKSTPNSEKSFFPSSTPRNKRSISLRGFLSFWSKSADELPVPPIPLSDNLCQVRQKYMQGGGTADLEELRNIGRSLEKKGERLYKDGQLNKARGLFVDAEAIYNHCLEGTILAMADTMHEQSLYHHDRGDTRLATVLIGAAGSIRERPTPKNILFCTRLHKQYHEYSKNHRKVKKYSNKMNAYIKIIQAQAPAMARVIRAQVKCRQQ